jgi:hypothetical protein
VGVAAHFLRGRRDRAGLRRECVAVVQIASRSAARSGRQHSRPAARTSAVAMTEPEARIGLRSFRPSASCCGYGH